MECEIAQHSYRIGKMSAMQQYHLVRKLGAMIPILDDTLSRKADSGRAWVAGAAVGILGQMSDADAEAVIFTCLDVVERKDGDRWVKVHPRGGNLQYDDIDILVLFELADKVVEENLGPFFAKIHVDLQDIANQSLPPSN